MTEVSNPASTELRPAPRALAARAPQALVANEPAAPRGLARVVRGAVVPYLSRQVQGLGRAGLAGVMLVVFAIAFFLVASSSSNPALFAERYPVLLGLNGAVALVLTVLVVYQLITLRRSLKAGVFGSRLTARLVLVFALMAVLPGALIYGLSVQFMTRSIESWFDVRVDKALESGLTLSRGVLDNMLRELAARGDRMALSLSTRAPAEQPAALNALREQVGVPEATLFSERGGLEKMIVSFVTDDKTCLSFYRAFKHELKQRYGSTSADVEQYDEPYQDGGHIGYEQIAIKNGKGHINALWERRDGGMDGSRISLSVEENLTVYLTYESSAWSVESDRRRTMSFQQ